MMLLYLFNITYSLYVVYKLFLSTYNKICIINSDSINSILFLNIGLKNNINEYFEKIEHFNYTCINVVNNVPVKLLTNTINLNKYIINLQKLIVKNKHFNNTEKLIIITTNNMIKNNILFYKFTCIRKFEIFSIEDFAKFLIPSSKIINYDIDTLSSFFKIKEEDVIEDIIQDVKENVIENVIEDVQEDVIDDIIENVKENEIEDIIEDVNKDEDIVVIIYKKLCNLLADRVKLSNDIVYENINLSHLRIIIDKKNRCKYTRNLYEKQYDDYIYNKLQKDNDSSDDDDDDDDDEHGGINEDNILDFEEIPPGSELDRNSDDIPDNKSNILKDYIKTLLYYNPQYVYEYLTHKGELLLCI